MKNTLWRFGDSWSITQDDRFGNIELNHSYYVSNYYGMELEHFGYGGIGNLQIFKKIIEQDKNYKKGDIILINFASRSRTEVIDDKFVICTADGCNKTHSSEILQKIIINDLSYSIQDIIFFLIKPYLKSLIDRGINVYHFYNDEGDIYQIENKLNFDEHGLCGFIRWCDDNGYKDLSPAGNLHYKVGSQKQVADKIIDSIEKNDTQKTPVG